MHQALKGDPLAGVLVYCSVCQAFKGPPSLGSFSIGHLWVLAVGRERENIMMVPSPACDSALLPCLAFLQRHFPLHLLPHAPLGHLPTVNSRLLLGIVLQYLYSSSQLPCIPRDFCPCPGHVGLWQGLSVWFLFRSDCHRSAAALSNGFKCFSTVPKASLVAQMLKNLPAVWETWVRSLGWKDPLEKGMATHSSILAWRTPMDRGTWQATVHTVAKSGT